MNCFVSLIFLFFLYLILIFNRVVGWMYKRLGVEIRELRLGLERLIVIWDWVVLGLWVK